MACPVTAPVPWRPSENSGRCPPGARRPHVNLALVYLGLGDRQRAIGYLEQAYAASSQSLVWPKIDPIYDPLRSDPRFIALMKRLNFVK